METVLAIGPYSEEMRSAFREALPENFRLEYIQGREEYDRLAEADYIVLRSQTLTAEDMVSMPRVKLIQRWGTGYDSVDIRAAAERGIPVAVAYNTNSIPTAELTLGLMLSVYRNIVPLSSGILEGRWERENYAGRSYTLCGKIVGIVGLGNIGRRVAALVRAFGASVIYWNRHRLSPEAEENLGVTYAPLETLWACSDIVTFHIPLTEQNERLINRDTLARMKDGAVIINTSREELVDLQALREALLSKKLSGAGLDAISRESMAKKPFQGLTNVVLTPHVGGNTADTAGWMARRCAENICAVSRGEKLAPPDLVNSPL